MSPEKDTGRLEAFSDGVFAIAITLLALELKRPMKQEVMSNKALWLEMLDAWPSFLTFFISFGSVLTMWVNHHKIFEMIRKVSAPLLFANGFLLMLVVTVPFTTALLTDHFKTPAANAATTIYAGVFVMISVTYFVLWYVASSDRTRLSQDVSEYEVVHLRKMLLAGIPAYVAAFVVSFFSAKMSLLMLMCLWLYWATKRKQKLI